MYEILFTLSAEKSYKKLDQRTRERVNTVLNELEQGRFQHPNVCVLHGPYKGYSRYRMGGWRIIFKINHQDNIVTIIAITTRGEAYKVL